MANQLTSEIAVELYDGVGKQSKKPFKAVRVQIGKYSTLVFPTEVEMDYVERILKAENKDDDLLDLSDD